LEGFNDLIKRVATCLNAAALDYMFTGALAASFYGIARTTVDVDIVVGVSSKGDKVRLVSALRQAGVRVDPKKVDAAFKSGYNVVTFSDVKSPYSVDVILSRSRRLGKRAGTIAGLPTFYQTPEDLVLAKLRMVKATVPRERTVKDEEDVRAILKFTRVNVDAVSKRAKKDGTLSILESIMMAARKPG